jgi:hypothetical protein
MKGTNVKASAEDLKKLIGFAMRGWMPGDVMITFSVGEGIRKDQNTIDAQKMCHKLALDYGLPEIEGFYGIKDDGEFVTI